jgi:hypothetical protein
MRLKNGCGSFSEIQYKRIFPQASKLHLENEREFGAGCSWDAYFCILKGGSIQEDVEVLPLYLKKYGSTIISEGGSCNRGAFAWEPRHDGGP